MTLQSASNDSITANFDVQAYKLGEKIGEGGFGVVYRAMQLNTGQTVAIKFLTVSAEFDAAKKQRYIERFERETLLCSRLQHPNIVRLLDKGQCDYLLYAVFEYVDGKTLKDTLIDAGSLSPVEASQIMAQVLDALSHAHEQGVVHRDIKPANIMLTKTGAKIHAKVLDFGIGALVDEARQLDYHTITLTQETLGTPSYSAPEQLRGEPPTPKTDIYVWGLVFIECLTGQPAISGASLAAVFHKQLSQSDVLLPAALGGHAVSGLLRRVLNKKASERAGNATQLYKEFTQFNFLMLVGDMNSNTSSHFSQSNTLLVRPGDDTLTMKPDDETLVCTDMVQSHTTLIERKQITTLCVVLRVKVVDDSQIDCDVVDALHRDQKAQCVDLATRYGAYHVGTLGYALLFYFGYPTVSDNDGRLCARTALEIASNVNKRNLLLRETQGIEVLAHMGMHTGVVTAYADSHPEGDAANIAMSLARLADANQVLSTDASKKLLDTYHEFQPKPSCKIGITDQQVPVFSLVGERSVEAFGFLRANKNNNTFIGREQALKSLQQVVSLAQGHGKFAHIHGEAGIGKSRLVFELRNLSQGFTHYVAQCLPEYKNNALYPILRLVKYRYSLDSLTPKAVVEKLFDTLAKLPKINETRVTPILCSWMALPLPKSIDASTLSPDVQKQVLFDALISLLVSLKGHNTKQPGLFLFEDMHWADPTSIEFVVQLSKDERFNESRDAFVSTSRHALPSALIDIGFTNISLKKLDQQKTRDFVINLFDNQNVSTHLLDAVVNRTDGIPLFIEELVDMLKQKGLVRHLNGITDFVNPDKVGELPGSLRDSLQQKLDSLGYAKETAQLAATIGREFGYDLLAAASTLSEAQLQIDLNALIDAELIYLQRKVAGDSYIFKHALVRDAATQSMGKQQSRLCHARIVDALKNKGSLEIQPLAAAHHLEHAGEPIEAIKYICIAAELSIEKSGHKEAQTQFKKALELFDNNDTKDPQLEIKLRNGLASSIFAADGWLTAEAVKQLEANQDLLGTNTDKQQGFAAQRGNWLVKYASGQIDEAHAIGAALYDDRQSYDISSALITYELMMQTCFCKSQLSTVRQYYDEFKSAFEYFKNATAIKVNSFGIVNSIACLAFMAVTEILENNIESAYDLREELEQAQSSIEADDIRSGICGLIAWFYMLHWCVEVNESKRADIYQKALATTRLGIELANKSGSKIWKEYNTMHLSALTFELDESFDINLFDSEISLFDAHKVHKGFCYILLSKRAFDDQKGELAKVLTTLAEQEVHNSGITYPSVLI